MAMKIPTVEGPSVQQQGIPDAYEQAPRALGQAGMVRAQQTADAANMAGKYAEALQRERDEMDQVRVDDALNKLKERQLDLTFNTETGFVHQKGIGALERKSGRPLAEEYTEQGAAARRSGQQPGRRAAEAPLLPPRQRHRDRLPRPGDGARGRAG